jgi:hypothetical protein
MIGDQRFTAWFAKHCRHSVSRGAILPLLWSSASAYLVDVFPAVRVPTLVLHRRDDRLVPVGQGHVLDLATPAAARTAPSIREALDAGMGIESGSTEPVIDDAARAAYQRRIAELRQHIEDAEIANDGEVVSMARQELDVLVEELASAYGLGGRPRRTPDHVERARKAVTRRIRDAVARIDRAHPTLGRHLHASVHTGVYCSYAPERDLVWTVDRGTELT